MRPRPTPLSVDGEVIRLFGLPAFSGPMDDLLPQLIRMAQAPLPQLVVTANVDHLIDLSTRSDFAHAYGLAALRTIDGMPLLALARLLGKRSAHRNTGADLIQSLPSAARDAGLRVALLGGRPGVAIEAARRLAITNPRLEVRGISVPYLTSPSDPVAAAAITELQEFQAQIVFLCLGAPKQELFFMNWQDQLPAGIYIGGGAAIDFAAGCSKRAPRLLQRCGLEWAWRLAHNPRRLARRYLLKGPRFLLLGAQSVSAQIRRD